jgi:hypothetical protein
VRVSAAYKGWQKKLRQRERRGEEGVAKERAGTLERRKIGTSDGRGRGDGKEGGRRSDVECSTGAGWEGGGGH